MTTEICPECESDRITENTGDYQCLECGAAFYKPLTRKDADDIKEEPPNER